MTTSLALPEDKRQRSSTHVAVCPGYRDNSWLIPSAPSYFHPLAMDDNTKSPSTSMFGSNLMITGGTFVQQIQGISETGFLTLKNAVAPGAFHNSGDRFDPPKCYPNTRVAIMKKIIDWAMGQDPNKRDALIMWLHGAAGAGKSAIAQSIAEMCYAEGTLLASFFFGRSDSNRNTPKALFSTIAYQIGLMFPQARQKLNQIMDHDSLMPTRSLETQFFALVVQPMWEVLNSSPSSEDGSALFIIIDGLDECLDVVFQRKILDVIISGVKTYHLPVKFLIASRPEQEISTRFGAADTHAILTRLFLDDGYQSVADIELFFREKFKSIAQSHPFKRYIPRPWPKDDVIQELVHRSSGQFIYAATVVKYLESNRHKPHQRLEVIMEAHPAKDQPFAELDALYSQIFSSVQDIDLVLLILAFMMALNDPFFRFGPFYDPDDYDLFLFLDPGDIRVQLSGLTSVIDISKGHFRHASLPDFLLDKSRSAPFFINMTQYRTELVRKSLQHISGRLFLIYCTGPVVRQPNF
ncbi:hypothetical protein CPB84DRAFT_186917 [Gymnopilus junonius]|uniref:Nephrocystin 3-like N-terminal domain-containing protein n=1 Tax=Gymnopilus junonius TaxID=109634 RepID=A0A9P5TI61_GYMJU|nr:hypothetical protein CPB84DRAFT_186917 [Gymnopilus junonius]